MLLKEYLLLNLGSPSAAEVERWRREMVVRRATDASRDLLAFWREGEDRLCMGAILAPRRGVASPEELGHGLGLAVAQALGHVQGAAAQAPWSAMMTGMLVGQVCLSLGAHADQHKLTNAIAYYFEEQFGYAQASVHPVAFEESMRPGL